MEKDYYIIVDGKQVPVTEEVYRAFKRPAWRDHKRSQVRRAREISADLLAESGYEIPSKDKLVDEIVEDKLMLDILLTALSELSKDERNLIEQIYLNEKTEREYSNESGLPQKTINNRKKAILKKLKKFF